MLQYKYVKHKLLQHSFNNNDINLAMVEATIILLSIIAYQIYYDMIIITICNSSPVWMIVEPQMTIDIWLQHNLANTIHYKH